MNLKFIFKLIKKEISSVNKIIFDQLRSDVQLVNRFIKYFNQNSGKKIRPIITLLFSKILGYRGKKDIIAASLIEFIHIATLLHDDIIDSSIIRRGRKKSSIVFGNEISVLVGDFVYAKSLKMIVGLNSKKVLNLISKTVHMIIEGEILQLSNRTLEISQETYMKIIYQKTSSLFETAAYILTFICNVDSDKKIALKNYGRHFGNAFQLINDIKDYQNCSNNFISKGNDLNDGNFTLPLIHVMQKVSKKESMEIKKVIQEGKGRSILRRISFLMKRYGSLEYSRKIAESEIKIAIQSLDHFKCSSYKTALIKLTTSIID
ncbi:polyprenyl synthetase family protein [Candidatus Riesia pediculicola]|uniref:Octaprenyl-diphosphate synthase n=1 Tax=Riesia pediculicola (strain USDA) TaxID=515618 RepID=D4G879_RIEPU|nr:polyprenyl synthetase family protein [Candidatus Riesia pediculicola]ADD79731.1 octaprenyl-diphosphate synthase [Candidatus Riesia pediculicola USDA]ARC53779.1 hypothetical protein AOE55_01275 [Candidatus Riesia pediculicola]QOJ86417.1 polyprenyl synthetase family protein [Candidatus Riesia pediculicola]